VIFLADDPCGPINVKEMSYIPSLVDIKNFKISSVVANSLLDKKSLNP